MQHTHILSHLLSIDKGTKFQLYCQFLKKVVVTDSTNFDPIYITFLMLFTVILSEIKIVFSLGKVFLSDEEIIPFERYNAL